MSAQDFVAGWAEEIEQAQRQPTETIGGKDYQRVKFGDDYPQAGQRCRDCGVERGQFHVTRCLVERCALGPCALGGQGSEVGRFRRRRTRDRSKGRQHITETARGPGQAHAAVGRGGAGRISGGCRGRNRPVPHADKKSSRLNKPAGETVKRTEFKEFKRVAVTASLTTSIHW